MNHDEYTQLKTRVLEKVIPWAKSGIDPIANKTIEVTVDWSSFDQPAPQEGVMALNGLLEQIHPVILIVRTMLISESFEQRQLVRKRVDGLLFEHTTDTQQARVSNDENKLVFRVIAGLGDASSDELWAAADVLDTMPQSPHSIEEETPFACWKLQITSVVLPQLQSKLSELAAKELTIDLDSDSFSTYEDAEDMEEIMKQFEELVDRVQFSIRGMLFTGGAEERQLVRTRVDRILFGQATDEKQPVIASDENTLVFLLSTDREPIEKKQLFFELPDVVKAMPTSPNPVEEETGSD